MLTSVKAAKLFAFEDRASRTTINVSFFGDPRDRHLSSATETMRMETVSGIAALTS